MDPNWETTLRFYRLAWRVCEGTISYEDFLHELATAAMDGTIPQAWNGDFHEELSRLAGRMTEGPKAVQTENWLG
ncbi:MAG: hypothetical protein RL681_697 [Candidatus Parcubacteria bacterium]